MSTINILPTDQIKYVKTISFDVQLLGNRYFAKIIYKRNPSATYRMDDTKRSAIDKMMCYYPEECYPKDEIDDIILKGVQKRYPAAKVSTQLMMFDVEFQRITQWLLNFSKESFLINIQPRIDDLDAILKSGKKQWRVFLKTLPLYILPAPTNDLFKNEGSVLYYDLDKENELIKLEPNLLGEVTTF